MAAVTGMESVKALTGKEFGPGEWFEVTQEQINAFADATGDHQWIHVDPERAKDGPFGTTIAHGFLTLSLTLTLMRGVGPRVEGVKMAINYGLNRVRFPAPVRVGKRIRARSKNLSVSPVDGGAQVVNEITVEIEGEPKPACVAEQVARYYF
ncbi:MAG: MaoC family dehydratase [Candidatus Dormibacteraeota bacterium]|nr:MaoC family dehydratase [Candidatus Dormibacteraeota bacterium]